MLSFRLLLISFVTLGMLTSALAQERNSQVGSINLTLSGVLTEAGTAVQGAKVEAFNLETRITKAAVTDAAGRFSIDGLAAGKYRLRVSRQADVPSVIVLEVDVELKEEALSVNLSLDRPPLAGQGGVQPGTRCTRLELPRASKSKSLLRGIKRIFGKGRK